MKTPFYRIHDVGRLSRRSFLATTSSLAAAAIWAQRACGVVKQNPKFSDNPFQLGVASGDPSPDGFVIWTRLAPKPLDGGGMPEDSIEVGWQVAEDEAMTKVVQQGTAVANSQFAHAVHVEVAGLQPNRWYWYQFRAGGEISPKGHTRTAPNFQSMPAKLRFAFASCQHFEHGLFTAYEHMLSDRPDLVVHLGDYIYEYPGADGLVRKHVGGKLDSLEDYRNRLAQYRTDEALQAMHAAAPWLVTWDDHEFENNYANDISERADADVDKFLAQRARAYQAYYEHMPLRRKSLPHGPRMELYRQVTFGKLVQFYVLDTRQYRTDQPCGDGNKAPCGGESDAQATLLGAKQRDWLCSAMKSSPATWNVLAQQVMMGRVDRSVGEEVAFSMDQWPGYESERRRLLKFFHDEKIANPVVLTGDIHSNWANELIADFEGLDGKTVAAEFVGSSLSSGGNGSKAPPYLKQLLNENPFVKFHSAERGYVRCDLTPQEWRTDYRMVEYVTKPGAKIGTSASFVLESGSPKLQKA